MSELSALGVSLSDDETGEVDFPTKINGKSAAFTWKLGEEAVRFWRYSGEEQRRPIPADWDQSQTVTPVGYRRQP